MSFEKFIMKVDNYLFCRIKRTGIFDNMSDEKYLEMIYRRRMKRKLNLENPQTFNEKLQWLKLHNRKPEYTKMVDKYEVKKYVADIIGEQYIIPTLGVWDKFEDINFDTLPNEFVLKCTHDSGGLVICKNKSKFDINKAKKIIKQSLNRNYYLAGREWPYKDVKPRIIAEKYMSNNSSIGLIDYKFFVFNGVVKFLYVSEGLENHSTAKISFVSSEWKKLTFKRNDYKDFDELPQCPVNLKEMIDLSEKLAINTKFVRIDFYEICNKVYFSEITFFPCSGMIPFKPKSWDEELGHWIEL